MSGAICIRVNPSTGLLEPYPCSIDEWWGQYTTYLGQSLAAAVKWCIDAINTIKANIAAWFYYFQTNLIEWAGSDWAAAINGILVVGFIIALWVVGPIVAELPIVAKVKLAMAEMKYGVGVFLNRLHLQEISALNAMLKVLWPSYRALAMSYENALAGLAEQLHLGAGTLVAIFGGVRAIIYSSYNILGLDPETNEMAWFESTQKIWQNIDADFVRYYANPGLIMDDVMESIILPAAEVARDAQVEILEDTRRLDDRLQMTATELENIVKSIDGIAEALPDQMTSHWKRYWEPWRDEFLYGMEVYRTEVLDRLSGVVEVWEDYAADQQTINARLLAEANNPTLMLRNMTGLSDKDRAWFLRSLAEGVGEGEDLLVAEDAPPALRTLDEAERRVSEAYAYLPSMPSLGYEPPGMYSLEAGPASDKTDWFIGEY